MHAHIHNIFIRCSLIHNADMIIHSLTQLRNYLILKPKRDITISLNLNNS